MKKFLCLSVFIMTLFICSAGVSAADSIYAASLEGEISLHISPDEDSYVITKIPACSKLSLIRTERTWGLVEFNNKAGWINISFTRDSYSKAAEATGNDMEKSVRIKTESGSAVLYNIPSDDVFLGSSEKYTVPDQTILKITRQTASGWGLASMHGKYAWIKMKDSEPFDTGNDADKYGIYYVYTLSEKGEGVKLWANANQSGLRTVIPDCIRLTVREKKGNYAYVSYDGINGWINLSYTTQSLANAQSNAGVKVNAEYIVTAEGDAVSAYTVPSENAHDAPTEIGTVKNGDSVYVLRSTQSGWSLINIGGVLGWLPPDSVELSEEIYNKENVTIYENPQTAFIVTSGGKGMAVYPDTTLKEEHSYVPETALAKVLAEKDGMKYVYSGYAAGWVKDVESVATYEEATGKYRDEKKRIYVTNRETQFMSLPTGSIEGGSSALMTVSPNTYFEAVRTVTSGKTKWLLAEIDGTKGWIKKSHTEKADFSFLLIGIILLFVIVLVIVIIKIRKAKKKRKGDNENEESIHNEHSGDYSLTSDVPGK